ncbi:molybdopterin-dependent oxidoreductase [Paenibacillus thalictri]|uniref:Oxidoreductase n=1 Tax=Paenibacillus thalictri TaxID=2527873 RepID=A0A4Q9DG50_9BACL|nr:molybdopterin-dependent oxidoreductase [Paenibacillus thalictri]TBL67909.1 oxidoreductase [Paenibacillus thalictri]
MERRGWLKQTFGKKLLKLHAWNAWLVLLLAVSGIILWVPSIRGDLGAFRVMLKWLHIVLGLVSIGAIALYIPLIAKHWRQIKSRLIQRWNLVIVLIMLAGWSLTGLVLWQFRSLPPSWSNVALTWHDLFTWVGIPYAAYHSISRSRWVKEARLQELRERKEAAQAIAAKETLKNAGQSDGYAAAQVTASDEEGVSARRAAAQAIVQAIKNGPVSRATFIRLIIGGLLIVVIGPSFYRWFKMTFNGSGTDVDMLGSGDANRMLPLPEPAPESATPIGGGLSGEFRIYTVTEFPVFTSENWKFAITGLVGNPQAWDWEQFLKLTRKVQVSNFHCVTGWSVNKVTWEGIPLSALLDMAKVKDTAKFVKFYSGDKVYTDALSLDQARMDDVMVAVLMDGKLIPQQLGGPVRLIVPQMYAYKSVKWLQAIELIDKEHIGYWEARGYDNDAWVLPVNKYDKA